MLFLFIWLLVAFLRLLLSDLMNTWVLESLLILFFNNRFVAHLSVSSGSLFLLLDDLRHDLLLQLLRAHLLNFLLSESALDVSDNCLHLLLPHLGLELLLTS